MNRKMSATLAALMLIPAVAGCGEKADALSSPASAATVKATATTTVTWEAETPTPSMTTMEIDSVADIKTAVESYAGKCTSGWQDFDEMSEARCAEPLMWVFYNPAGADGLDLVDSTAEVLSAAPGVDTVFTTTWWVIATDAEHTSELAKLGGTVYKP